MAMSPRRLLFSVILIGTAVPLRAQVTLVGTVTDSVSRRPLAGTLVQIMRDSTNRPRSTHSDSLGAYRFDSLTAGSYIIGFFDPMLDSIGIELTPRRIRVGPESPTHVDLAIPSPKTIIGGLCASASSNDSLGMLLGHVRDAESGMPRVGDVTVTWMELSIGQGGIRRERRQFPSKTDVMGWYAFCGIPSDVEVTVSARADSLESGVVELRVPAGGILIRDFFVSRADSTIAVLGDSTPGSANTPVATLRRGHSRITGVVHNDKGQPVHDAEVSVPGTGLQEHTGETGTFTLSGLPAGTQTLDVRALGFEPKRMVVDLTPARLTTVDVGLEHRVQTLDVVTVYGTSTRSLAEFERRRRAGWGHILTPAQIADRHALNVSDLFRTIPGVRVSPTRGFGKAVRLRGGCLPTVYLNGMRMSDDAATMIDELASADEITAVEVYSTAERPAEFWGNNCGTVVLWAGMLPR
jgi:carboxypeptidase family protein/TonB-dependent receptor-like protein